MRNICIALRSKPDVYDNYSDICSWHFLPLFTFQIRPGEHKTESFVVWQQQRAKLKENKKKNIFRRKIFVSIHEGLLMNGIFIKLHFKSEHDVWQLIVLSRQYILLYRNPGHHKRCMAAWCFTYLFYNTGRTLNFHFQTVHSLFSLPNKTHKNLGKVN